METINIWLPKVSMLVGIVAIILLSCDDFHKNIRKFISRWRYYLAGTIFVSINLFIYLALTYAMVQTSPTVLIAGNITLKGNYLDMLMPLVLAFVYFGAGAGNFRLGTKEIQWNQYLRKVLEGLFNSKPLGPGDVHFSKKETEQLYAMLREKTERVEVVARDRKWDRLLSKWYEFQEDEVVLQEQLTYLKRINNDLALITTELPPDSAAAGKLAAVTQKIDERIRKILKSLIKKAQKLLVAYAFKYYKDEAELEKYLIAIEVLDPTHNSPPHIPSVINRGLILGFMFGLLFGPVFGIYTGADVTYYCWRGAITLMLFTGCVSYGVHSRNWKKAVFVSGLGGYFAHLFWRLIDIDNLKPLLGGAPAIVADPHLYKEPIVGLSYGVVTALILYALKFKISDMVSNKYALYAIATLSGAITYPLLNYLISYQERTASTGIVVAWIGAIVLCSMAIAANISSRFKVPTGASPSAEEFYCPGCTQEQTPA